VGDPLTNDAGVPFGTPWTPVAGVKQRWLVQLGTVVAVAALAGCQAPEHPSASSPVPYSSPSTVSTVPPTTVERVAVAKAPPPPTTTPPPTAPPGTCDPSSPDLCLDPTAEDYDCQGGSGNGPRYVDGPIRVRPPDQFGLDSDGDGLGCE